MKRSPFLLIFGFALLSICISIGFNDSGVKKATSYQIISDASDCDFDLASDFVMESYSLSLSAPDFGREKPREIFVAEKSTNGYSLEIRPPPDRFSKNHYIL
jgi:hypothetical protein